MLLRHTIALGRLVVYTITLNHLNACGWAYIGLWYKDADPTESNLQYAFPLTAHSHLHSAYGAFLLSACMRVCWCMFVLVRARALVCVRACVL